MAPRSKKKLNPSMWRDRSAVLRSTVVAGGLILSMVGCGALMPGGSNGSGTAPGQVAQVAGDGPGVTDESVKVVFIGTDLVKVEALTGFTTQPVGDLQAQAEALADWVNDNGGLAGRRMEAVYHLYDASTDTPATEEQLCKKITQDDKAFAVVLTGQYQPNARPCYAQAKTLMLEGALNVAADQEYYDELAPFLWAPSFPEYGEFTRAQFQVMEEEGFFSGGEGLGVVAADNQVNRRIYDEIVVPRLEEAGVDSEVSWIDTTDMTSLFSTLTEAATQFRNKEYGNVVFLGGSRMASMFDSASATVRFSARYVMTSYDNPTYFINNPENLSEGVRTGMVGVGFHPAQEVIDTMPFPNDNEKVCTDIYADAGITWDNREGARVGLPYCDSIRLLKLGADAMDSSEDFNAWTWADAVRSEGGDFVPAAGFGNGFASGGNTGAGGYRVMRFDEASERFVYEGEERSFNDAQ